MKKTPFYTKETVRIPSCGRQMKLLIFRPVKNAKSPSKTPGILWIHGGGYMTGMAEMIYMSRALPLVKKYGAVVVTPQYRLSGKYPNPFAPNGGLTAALCMYARNKGDIQIAFQMPLYPMLDDRDTPSSRNNHAPVWNTRWNHLGWKTYLGPLWKKEQVPAYAAPARQTDYTGLPPAYTFVGDIEPFYCETLTYIKNLKKAGIKAAVHVYPGCFHAFDMLLPFLPVSKKAAARFEKAYLYAARHFFAPQKR